MHARNLRRAARLVALMALASCLCLASQSRALAAEASAAESSGPIEGLRRIGVIGAGHMGGELAALWAKAGYEVMISSREPQQLTSLAHSMGPNARVGSPREAAAFGDVVLIAVPYGAEPQVGRELSPSLAGKVVIDLGNPYPNRDGPMAEQARREGTGVASAHFFPGVQLARAFNALTYIQLRDDAHRSPDPVAVPIAADGAHARDVAARLVRAAGYAPVVVGGLSSARRFDVGSAVYLKPMDASQLRAALDLPAASR